MSQIFLLVGPPAVGKSTTARALAAQFPKSLHVPVDIIRKMVVSGLREPGIPWDEELKEQLILARGCVAQMAIQYSRAGFTVVIDDFWDPDSWLEEYHALFGLEQLQRIILYPSQETALARNRRREGSGEGYQYIAGGIHMVYAHLEHALLELQEKGWLVLDTTTLSPEETAARIMDRDRHNAGNSPAGDRG